MTKNLFNEDTETIDVPVFKKENMIKGEDDEIFEATLSDDEELIIEDGSNLPKIILFNKNKIESKDDIFDNEPKFFIDDEFNNVKSTIMENIIYIRDSIKYSINSFINNLKEKYNKSSEENSIQKEYNDLIKNGMRISTDIRNIRNNLKFTNDEEQWHIINKLIDYKISEWHFNYHQAKKIYSRIKS